MQVQSVIDIDDLENMQRPIIFYNLCIFSPSRDFKLLYSSFSYVGYSWQFDIKYLYSFYQKKCKYFLLSSLRFSSPCSHLPYPDEFLWIARLTTQASITYTISKAYHFLKQIYLLSSAFDSKLDTLLERRNLVNVISNN